MGRPRKNETHEEYLARERELHRAYRETHLERERARDRARYAADPETKRSKVAAYKRANPEVIADQTRRRRAAKSTGAETFTTQDLLALFGSDCHLCHKPIDLAAPRGTKNRQPGWERGLQIDHVIALANGGTHTIDNCRPAHALCNLTKGAR